MGAKTVMRINILCNMHSIKENAPDTTELSKKIMHALLGMRRSRWVSAQEVQAEVGESGDQWILWIDLMEKSTRRIHSRVDGCSA